MPKKVTLILGAGSSCMYGGDNRLLPTADGLKRLLISSGNYFVRKPPADDPFLHEAWDRQRERIRTSFAGSGAYSIDRFLERRSEFEEAGKLMIADCLLPIEMGAIVSRSLATDWYQWLFNQLYVPSTRLLHTTGLNIVTFNYDRTLEYAMHTMLHHTTGKPMPQVESDLATFPVNHVYGSLVSPVDFDPSIGNWIRRTSTHDVEQSAKSIHIISNAREARSAKNIEAAKAVVKDADVLVFLGFGYDQENMQRIGINSDAGQVFFNEIGELQIWGCAYGLGNRERSDADYYLRATTLGVRDNVCRKVTVFMGNKDEGCETFLRERINLKTLLEVPK